LDLPVGPLLGLLPGLPFGPLLGLLLPRPHAAPLGVSHDGAFEGSFP
jgi:hypothetical protein